MPDNKKLAARPQEQDCAKPYAEIKGEWQPSQPQHDGPCYEQGVLEGLEFAAKLVDRFKETKLDLSPVAAEIRKLKGQVAPVPVAPPREAQDKSTCEWCDGLAIACADCLKRFEGRDFQRGAQAMAEKAAQALDSIPFSNDESAWTVWQRCVNTVRSLAGAVEPPQEKEQP